MIELANITKTYRMGSMDITVLFEISLNVQFGELIAVMGPSGSGKSTLMNILGCLDRPTSGVYHFENREISTLMDDELASVRNVKIGFVFQTFNLLPTLTASENIEIALRLASVGRRESAARAGELLRLVGLSPRALHKPRYLSGGERQRVAIARSLANRPQLLLADEPTGNLDSQTGTSILELLRDLCTRNGQTVILVTHDFRAASYADRVLLLRDGRIHGETSLHAGQDSSQVLGQLLSFELQWGGDRSD